MMKRRTFGQFAGASLAALRFGEAKAQSTTDAPTLPPAYTPLGSEKAGNADGSIPEWTGGMTSLPPGISANGYVPELFPDEQPVVVVDASNMAEHISRLSEGVQVMMTKYGYNIKVYPTHRTAACPQYVYDNIARNYTTAKLNPGGGRLGFTGAYGGVPFPVPDVSDPFAAGAQIIWNHICAWRGYQSVQDNTNTAVTNGQVEVTSRLRGTTYFFKYYDPAGSLSNYDGLLVKAFFPFTGPPNLQGQAVLAWTFTDPAQNPDQDWELENGQARVRRAPELQFDTPSFEGDGIYNEDESFGFYGSLEKYDWRCLGREERYIPYNNNGLYAVSPQEACLPHFLNPDLVRWELHRCWVVEATLHPGERNVLAKRRFYVDEDTYITGIVDAWDANDNLVKINQVYNNCRPDLPGTIFATNTVLNLQTGNYASIDAYWNQKNNPTGLQFVNNIPESALDPNNLAASAQY
jgi:hypothetical protein